MKRKYIYLRIEIKAREFYPKLWLASRLVKRGFVCILGDKPGVHYAMRLYPKGVYYHKSISHQKTKRLLQFSSAGHILVCQDEEAGIAKDEVESFFKIRISEENIRLTSRFYCWGTNDYEYLLSSYNDYKGRFRITGSPRIDLWRGEICKKIYHNEIKNLTTRYGSFVLINSAFGSTSEAEVEKIMVQALAYGNISEKDYDDVKKDRLRRLDEFYAFVDMIHAIAKSRPHQSFVARPHPAENLADWKELINDKSPENLFLVREGDVTPWIAACKALIHEGCTTGMQGVLMSKPVISFKPENQDNDYIHFRPSHFSNTISYNTSTVQELSQALDMVDNGWNMDSSDYLHKLEKLKHRIANLNGQYAAELIAEDLSTLDVPVSSRLEVGTRLYYAKYREMISKIYSKLIHGKAKPKSKKERQAPKVRITPRTREEKIPGGIQEDEIREFMKNLEQIDSDIKNIRINKLWDNVFEFYR